MPSNDSLPGRRSHWRSLLAVALLSVSLLPETAPAETEATLVPTQRFELANGMRFVVVERPLRATVAAGWLVEVGTAHDPLGRIGLSHLLEHLMFQGTGTIRPGELDTLYAAAGATGLNALTRRDFTAYFVTLPAEKLELWFWLESDRLLDARFRDLDAERAAILEERRLRVEATPTGEIEQLSSSTFWGAHPYGRPNAGRPEELRALTLEAVREHYERHYRPDKLTAVLVGPVSSPEVRTLAELYFGRLETASPRPASEPIPLGAGPSSVDGDHPRRIVGRCDCRPRVHLSYPAPAFPDAESVTAEVLVALLNGRSGRLHRALVLEDGEAFAAYARHTRLRHAGRLTLVAEARDGTAVSDLARRLEDELALLSREAVGEYELTKAKNRLAANTLRRLEEPSELLLELLFHHGLGRGDLLDHWGRELTAVSADDVRRLAGRLVRSEHKLETLFLRTGGPQQSPAPRNGDTGGVS